MTVEQLKLLADTVQKLSLARSMEEIMKVTRKSARVLTGADGATFVLKENGYCYYADEDAIGPLWKGQRFPLKACVSGWAMINRQAAVIPDIYTDERVPVETYKSTFVRSLVMVPIRKMDPIGAIGSYWAEPHSPTDVEIELLQTLADITSVSVVNVNVYKELEQRVRERTKELENANSDLESFSYSVSHDLRAPLRSIIGFSKILKEEAPDSLNEDANNALEAVIRNGERMSLLIDDLLEFSRAGRSEPNKSSIEVKSLVKEVMEECMQHEEKDRRIEFKCDDLPACNADYRLFKQVWINLVSNALKYTRGKNPAEIGIGSYTENGKTVYTIRDNGVGFDMKYYNKLFGVFQRLHTLDTFEGTGVGLALVKRIVTRHGGNVWAEAEPDKGAVFYFTVC